LKDAVNRNRDAGSGLEVVQDLSDAEGLVGFIEQAANLANNRIDELKSFSDVVNANRVQLCTASRSEVAGDGRELGVGARVSLAFTDEVVVDGRNQGTVGRGRENGDEALGVEASSIR